MWALASIREKTSYVFEWGLRKTCRPSRAWQRPCVERPSHSHSFCLVTPTSVNCIHVAMWSVSRTFLSCKTETNSYLLNNFSFSLPSRLSHQPSYFLFLWMTALNRSHKETHTELFCEFHTMCFQHVLLFQTFTITTSLSSHSLPPSVGISSSPVEFSLCWTAGLGSGGLPEYMIFLSGVASLKKTDSLSPGIYQMPTEIWCSPYPVCYDFLWLEPA